MEERSDDMKLKLYRNSIATAWPLNLRSDWPIKLNAAFHLFLNEFSQEFLDDLDYCENNLNFSINVIAKLFNNPARIYRITDSILYGMRRKNYSLQHQREVLLKLIAMVKSLKYGSEFNEDGKNLIFTPEQIEKIVDNKLKSKNCRLEESRIIHIFCGILWAYTETIFFRAHDVTKEIHGPYYHNKDFSNILIKEYLNLSPNEIWPEVKLLPFNKVIIYKNYCNNIEITIDALNHICQKRGNLINDLKQYYIEVDGKEMDTSKLGNIINIIKNSICEITNDIEKMSWHEKVIKYAEIFWYRKKPLRDALKNNWKVPKEVISNIYAGAPNPKRLEFLSKEQIVRLANLTI